MRKFLILLPFALVGCGSDSTTKPDTGAPQVKYQMVPATTGGGAAPSGSTPAAPATGNPSPPSAGSD